MVLKRQRAVATNNYFGRIAIAILIFIMLTIVFSQTSQSTIVIKTDTASQFVRANQTDICVMNFTLSTQNDIRICGITPAIGQFLENSSQEEDWGFYSPQIICYDSNQDGGDYNWSMDCIWISNASFPHEYYNSSDTILNGTAPPEGTNPTTSPGCFRGCKAPVWRHVKSYDALDGGNWSQDADSIIYEGADINNAFNDQLNAVTFKINSSSNATQTDVSSFSLWCESGDHLGFQNNEDMRLQTVLYSSETSSWNVTALDSDINIQATFYATVNISATASHDKSLRFWIPTKIDGETTGQYNDGDQGMFLAGCNDTGNLLNTNYLITDIYPPLTNANPITEYWKTGSSVNISAQATDNGSGTSSVSLYYRYRSSNGSSWGVPVFYSTDSNPTDGFSFHFVFPLNGHYGFFTRGADNISNIEASRTTNDTTCAYDSTAPISSVDTFAPYWKTTTPQTISYTASDNGTGSGLHYCQLYYRYSVNNASWGGWVIGGNDSDPWTTKQWSFSFTNGSGFYQFYTRASDNVSNLEAAPAGYDAICGYDATPPLSSVNAISSFWRKTSPLTITATASDSTSNVKNVTLYYRFSSNNASWGGWRSFGVDTASPWSWSFTFSNGSGYYQFYSLAKDYASNAEPSPAEADTQCGYDTSPPLSGIDAITPYWKRVSPLTVTATASDSLSGVTNVTLYYRWTVMNGSWPSWTLYSVDTASPWSWSFTFPYTYGYYQFYSIAKDNAGNTESAPINADAQCGIDTIAPASSVNSITPYWKVISPKPINITMSAEPVGGSSIKNATLYYRFSTNNASWGTWTNGGVDTTYPYSVSFTFPNDVGYYQFYSIVVDYAGNTESAPASADAKCGYDSIAPTSSVNSISTYWKKTSPLTITATASDSTSNVKNVTLYYRFSSNNASWGGWRSFGVDTASPWSWSFTFSNGSGHYQFYSIAKDYATNVEATTGTADTICGYDTVAPTCSIAYNKSATYLKSGTALKIYVNFTELLSGINESFIKINISTAGDGDLYNTTLSRINNTHWYKDWIIPAGSDDDGIFTVKIYARDNISNNLASYPTTSSIKKIDNTNPICSMSFNQSKTSFKEGDVLRIYGNFTESGAGMNSGSVTIRIDTAAGSGNLSNTSMIEIDMRHYYYDWSIPPGSENDGSFMVKIYAQDNLTNLLASYPTTNTTKMIDNTPPVASIEYNTTRTCFNYYPALKIYANFTEEGSGVDLSSMYLLLSTPDMTINTSMTALDDLHYYYNWTIPESTNDGVLTTQLFAQDTAGNILSSYPTRDESKNIDTTAPLISSISSNQITSTSATITWSTNENATTCVQYGTTISYGNWSNSSEPTTSHSQTLEGLLKASLYHYQVLSTDSAGNTATSPDNTYTTKFGGGGVYHGGGATPLKPIANAGGPYEGYVNSTIIFSGSLSRDTHGTIVGYRWDWNNDGFYDTNWSVSATTTHVFTVLGNYSVRLQVKDNDGLTGTIVTTVTVRTAEIQNRAPVATTNGPYNGLMYQDINFNASGSFSNDSSISNYTWDFGDGCYGYGMSVIHRYNSSGVFPVSLTITDNHNIQVVTSTTATILPDLNRDNVSDIMERIIGINITPSDIQLLSVTNMTYDLVDINDDGFFELMFNPETNIKTTLEYQEGNILLDTNGDGQWNYLYDPVQNMLIPYSDMHRVDEMPILILLFLTGILMVVAVIIGMKKRYRP